MVRQGSPRDVFPANERPRGAQLFGRYRNHTAGSSNAGRRFADAVILPVLEHEDMGESMRFFSRLSSG
jgi:hypothetical protein